MTSEGEIVLKAEQDIAFTAPEADETVDKIEDENGSETSEDLEAEVCDESLESILRHPNVLDNLEPSYGLISYLIECGVLDPDSEEYIQEEGTGRCEQRSRLLHYIDNSNLNSFLDGLRKSMQSHLAAFIEGSIDNAESDSDEQDDWPLDEAERKTINKLYVLLIREMTTDEILEELLTESCISEQHTKWINKSTAQHKRNRELLDIIRRRSKKHVEKFWQLVIKHDSHLKGIIEQFRVPRNSMALIRVDTKDNPTEEQKNKIRATGSRRADDAAVPVAGMEGKPITFCISGEKFFAAVPIEDSEIDSSSMIVSEEMKSLMKEALISCTGGDGIIVETLENVEYNENLSMNESDVERRIFSLNTSTRVIKQNRAAAEVTAVDDKIFVAQDEQPLVKVYNSSTLAALPDIDIPDMKNPVGMAGCSHNKLLYISDFTLLYIHKVNITDNSVKRLSVKENYWPLGVSMTSQHNVLVAVRIRDTNGESRIVELNSEGQLIRDIELDKSIEYAQQTFELLTDRFLISHEGPSSHRLCVVSSGGEIINYLKFSGEEEEGEGQLNDPESLTIDKNREIVYVADKFNSGVVMLDYNLKYLGLVQSSERFRDPARLHFDLNSDQLIAGETGWRTPRLLIISPDSNKIRELTAAFLRNF